LRKAQVYLGWLIDAESQPVAPRDVFIPPHATADSDDNAGGLKAGEAVNA